MANVRLQNHNKRVVQELKKVLAVEKSACTVRATGTGKSYISYFVAKDYVGMGKVLILVPKRNIIAQHSKLIDGDTRFILKTYQAVSNPRKKFVIPTDLSLIILDEFHRALAPKWWANGVEPIINANPDAKLLGTTATNVRSDGTDAAKIFGGRVVDPLSFQDAVDQYILPKFKKYVIGLYTTTPEGILDALTWKNKILKPKVRKEYEEAVQKWHVCWKKSKGPVGIIKRHVPKRAKRVLVFFDKIENLQRYEPSIKSWFIGAGFNPIMYQVHSGQSSKDNSTNLDGFEAIKPEHVNILLSINMLNEGYHLENGIDCAIFLRKTDSTIIYSQQRGRLFSSKSKKEPVALDLVCNIENNGKLIELINNAAKTKTKKVTCSIIDNIPFIIDDLVLGLVDIRNRLLLTDPVYQFTELVKKCKADPTYIPSIDTKTTLYGYILNRKYKGDVDAIIVWERIRKRTDKTAKMVKMEAEKCENDPKYIPEIEVGSRVYSFIINHKSGSICSHNPDCDIVWEKIKKNAGPNEMARFIKLEAERCRKDENYIPEIEVRSKVYFYILTHKLGSKYSHNPNCDIVWGRIRDTKTDKMAEVVKMEAEKCKKDKKICT